MNLNKYDAQGWPYSPEEAAERAFALLSPVYLYRGAKPYNAGRNAAKRLARK